MWNYRAMKPYATIRVANPMPEFRLEGGKTIFEMDTETLLFRTKLAKPELYLGALRTTPALFQK